MWLGSRRCSGSGPGGKTGGQRRIDPHEAAVVRRIFRDYAAGKTPEQIAKELNRDGVPGPSGRPWSNTTLRGHASGGTGILNNALYVGRIAWSRCSYVKDPESGKRVARPNPPETWEVVEGPDLAMIDQELWDRVNARQGAVQVSTLPDIDGRSRLNRARGARFLLSGKLHCGCCGGPYALIGKDRFGWQSGTSEGPARTPSPSGATRSKRES